MNMLDLLIGITLMNAMPHYVLGVWRARMLSGFGTGHLKNILWGLLNFIFSLSLFLYKYGTAGLLHNGIYLGECIMLGAFFVTSWFWYWWYYQKHQD